MTAKVKPLYVLAGTDGFLRDAYKREIISHVLSGADPQLCVSTFDATAELAEVLDELRTAPFLAPIRVVIISDADAFISAYRDRLEAYLDAPSASGVLVISVASWPGNTRLAKLAGKIGEVRDCTSPKARNLPGWLKKAFGKRGKKIKPVAAAMLVECIGEDLSALDSEVEKLSAYVGQRETVERTDVAALVTATAGPAAFSLSRALADGNLPAALKILDGMLTVRGEEFRTLGQIAWHLRRVMKVHQQIAAGQRVDAAMKDANVSYDKARFMTLIRRRPLESIQNDFRSMIRCDLSMKSGTDARTAMRDLLVALCS